MAKNAQEVRVALTGSVWYRKQLTGTIPDLDATAAEMTAAGFVDLGYTTTDGVTFNFGREVENIEGWQTSLPLRRLVLAEPKSAAYVLHQTNRDTWLASMGGTVTELTPAVDDDPAVYRWEPDEGQIIEGVLLVDFSDQGREYRFGFRRAQQAAEVEFQLTRTAAVNLPNTWEALALSGAQKSFYMDTNDPAFAPATP